MRPRLVAEACSTPIAVSTWEIGHTPRRGGLTYARPADDPRLEQPHDNG
jgi:hypothetical protein